MTKLEQMSVELGISQEQLWDILVQGAYADGMYYLCIILVLIALLGLCVYFITKTSSVDTQVLCIFVCIACMLIVSGIIAAQSLALRGLFCGECVVVEKLNEKI